MPIFCPSYIDSLDKRAISQFCKKCGDYQDGLCDLINDGAGAIDRFCECDVLQEWI